MTTIWFRRNMPPPPLLIMGCASAQNVFNNPRFVLRCLVLLHCALMRDVWRVV